jgi:hypothetical protein
MRLAYLEARHVALHNEGVDAAVTFVGVGLGDDEVGRGAVTVGDPVLRPVQEVVVPHVDGRGALRGGVGSSFGLGEAEGADFLA